MKKFFIILAIVISLIIIIINFWEIPYYIKFEEIKLPEDCEIVYKTKVKYTDIYNGYILCEKVVKCDKGSEYVEQYIRENNKSIFANNVNATDYFDVLSDMRIYYWEYDDNFNSKKMSQEEKDKYVHIGYVKD